MPNKGIGANASLSIYHLPETLKMTEPLISVGVKPQSADSPGMAEIFGAIRS